MKQPHPTAVGLLSYYLRLKCPCALWIMIHESFCPGEMDFWLQWLLVFFLHFGAPSLLPWVTLNKRVFVLWAPASYLHLAPKHNALLALLSNLSWIKAHRGTLINIFMYWWITFHGFTFTCFTFNNSRFCPWMLVNHVQGHHICRSLVHVELRCFKLAESVCSGLQYALVFTFLLQFLILVNLHNQGE